MERDISILLAGDSSPIGVARAVLEHRVVDPQWSWVGQFDSGLQLSVRAFQGRCERRSLASRWPEPDGCGRDAAPPAAEDPLDRLERIAALRERGLLPEQEFARAERRLLDQV